MLVDLTDKEIKQLGSDRWLRPHALKISIWLVISIIVTSLVTISKPDDISIIAGALIMIAAASPLYLGLIYINIKTGKAGKSLLKEIKGAK